MKDSETTTTAETPPSSRDQILDAAARIFGAKGYDGTSVRQIAAELGISAPALYHHFLSKEELFCATHERGLRIISALTATAAATMDASDPWDKLEAAAVAHCEALLCTEGYRTIISPQFPDVSDDVRARLVQQRDSYETIIKRLISELNLPAHIDPFIFRMQLLGSLNWTTAWFQADGSLDPTTIARRTVRQLRDGIHPPHASHVPPRQENDHV
ncbi:TetR/AcrR family transcriptional regulator [Sulfitobacter sp. F26204]|uniref:TetR/AcrR family transcriptional regulator n=1 Tax=Sulfitobacter sp. F26204 TaxID=2996014 RepID=UPI00225E5EB5|nr:TetR/AcrR family transcriptional regulator [Sulfitobacter sp. F26204]MCX7560626.1 TetR/AcrR family transcriptional regulator [Sulfitobacter sp. F26204]